MWRRQSSIIEKSIANKCWYMKYMFCLRFESAAPRRRTPSVKKSTLKTPFTKYERNSHLWHMDLHCMKFILATPRKHLLMHWPSPLFIFRVDCDDVCPPFIIFERWKSNREKNRPSSNTRSSKCSLSTEMTKKSTVEITLHHSTGIGTGI